MVFRQSLNNYTSLNWFNECVFICFKEGFSGLYLEKISSDFIIYYQTPARHGGTHEQICVMYYLYSNPLISQLSNLKFILLIRRIQFVNFYKQFKFQINYTDPIRSTCSAPGTNPIFYLNSDILFLSYSALFRFKYI